MRHLPARLEVSLPLTSFTVLPSAFPHLYPLTQPLPLILNIGALLCPPLTAEEKASNHRIFILLEKEH